MRSNVFIAQAFATVRHGVKLALSMGLLAGLTGSPALAKSVQVEGVHYQPEGLVIQLSGGKIKAPAIETWPNMKDGVNTELVMIRIPNCDGNLGAMQQAATQEIGQHPEIKQFWITPLNTEKPSGQGIQIALEVVTSASKTEFTPDVLSQGDDQWVITLQSVATKTSGRSLKTASLPNSGLTNAEESESQTTPVGDQFAAEPVAPDRQSIRLKQKVAATNSSEKSVTEKPTGANAQDLLGSLNQARQKQAELGAQVAALQKALAESNAQKDSLQNRLNGYENLLEEVGVDPNDTQKEDRAIIQNLKSALVKVAQKLKAAEEALAKETTHANVKPASKPAQSMRNLVDNQPDDTPPLATLGIAEGQADSKLEASAARKSEATKTPVKNQVLANATPSLTNVYKVSGSEASSSKKTATAPPSADMEKRLQTAIQKNPLHVDNYLSLADYYVARQDLTKARDTLQKLTLVEPGGAKGYYYLTMIYLSQQDAKNARTAMEMYVKRNPKDAQGIATLKKAIQLNAKPATGKPAGNGTPAAHSPEAGTPKMAMIKTGQAQGKPDPSPAISKHR